MNATSAATSTLLLGHSGNWWDSWMVASLALVAAAAAIVVFFTAGSVITHKREAEVAKAEALRSAERLSANEAETARAIGDAAIANEGLAKANADIANANARTAEAKLETERLRADFANRRITADQHKVLVDALSKHRGTINFDMMGDTESGLYAADLLKTFTDAGWTVGEKTFPLGEIWTGLSIENTPTAEATVVLQAFHAAHVPLLVSHRGRPSVTLMVGGKPPVF